MISSQDLEITDLFENENIDNVTSAVQQNEGDTEEGNANDDSTATTAKRAAKRVIRNPQPKLNPQRLLGDRGIVQLPKIFSEVKLKGKGHEKEDLDRVMKTLEHWSHRLFPKFTFDDVLERIEKLGSKKPVQNCINRIRLDMPVLSEDYVDNKDDIVDSEDENPPPVIDEQLHATIFGSASTSQENRNVNAATSLGVPQANQVLTADQLARIEQNRLVALERRAARLQQAAHSDAALNEEMTMIGDNHSNVSNDGTTFDTLSHNKKDCIEQTADSNTMLIDEDLLSTLQDPDVITTTKDIITSGVGLISTACKQMTKDTSMDGSDNMKIKTKDDEVHATTKSETTPSSSRSNSQIVSDSSSDGSSIICDNEVCEEKTIIETKSQDRVEDMECNDVNGKKSETEEMEVPV